MKHPLVPGVNAADNALPSTNVVLAPVPIVNISASTVSTVNVPLIGAADNASEKLKGPAFDEAEFALDVILSVGCITAIF